MGLGLSLPFAMDALDQLVARRRQERLQDEAIREQIRQFNVNAQERSRAHDLQLRQQDLNEALRRDTLGATEQHRQDLRAQNYVTGMTPPTPDVGEQMAGQIRSIGLGGALRTAPAKVLGGESQGLDTFPPATTAPPTFVRGAEALPQGGFGYQAARQAAEERAAQERDKQAAIDARSTEKITETQRHNQVMEGFKALAGNQDIAPAISGPALDMTAKMYAKTGQLPPMGMGKAGAALRTKILDRAAQYDPNTDSFAGSAPPDIASARSTFEAGKNSEKQLTQNINAVSAFAATAERNAALLNDVMKRVPDTGLPFLNRPLRELATRTGDPAMAELNAIRQSVANEYSRLISQPNLTGVLSDTARREAEAVLRGDATPQQMARALQTLATEGRNRRTAYQQQLDSVRRGIRGAPGGGGDNDPLGIR